MNRTKVTKLTLASLCLLVLTTSCGSSSSTPPPSARDQQEKFVQAYVAARQSKDATKIVDLFHPSVRVCITAQNRPYFDFVVAQELRDVPSGNYTKLTIKPVPPKGPPMIWAFFPAKGFPYAVMPTHTIQMDYDLGPNNSYSNIIEVAPSSGSFYLVTACPNAQGMKFMHQFQAQGERQKARAKKLVSELHDPLLSQIKALLAKHDRIGADKAYEKATGADLTTAETVMDALENRNQ